MQEEITFGTWLRKRRRSLDLTQRALADQVGCARITLRRIESDTLKPSKELAFIILEKVGIPQAESEQWLRFARGQSGLPSKESSPAKQQSNLPASLTSFIGREKEQTEIIKLIHKHRLVTLTGSGGVGKTRLSLKVGEQLLTDFADGVWLVELAPLSDPALPVETVAAVFRVTTQSNSSIREVLINFLREKKILLILDNCEHLLNICAQLADALLKSCPTLKILATSREALGITGEVAYRVPSLELPDLQQFLGKFRDYESVRLFEERAQLVETDFSLTLHNASSVAQICLRLDGIPLSLELAAARVNILSTEQIASQLNESFQLLTGGSRTALPRQQTIRASIDWSWNLLTVSEQILLRRLSVFAGNWTLEAAETIVSQDKILPDDVLDLLTQLVNKSLLVIEERGTVTRYRLLETVRQYALEKLLDSGESERLCDRHLSFFLSLAESAETTYPDGNWLEWIPRLEIEHDNLRAALEWACDRDSETARWLAGLLRWFWHWANHSGEARTWYVRVLGLGERAQTKSYAIALFGAGMIATVLNDLDEAHVWLEESIILFRTLGNKQWLIDGLTWLGYSMILSGQAEQACVLFEENVSLIRQSAGPFSLSTVLSDWGRALANARHDYGAAQILQEESIAIARAATDALALGTALSARGYLATQQGDYDMARQCHLESLAWRRQTGTRWLIAISSQNLADVMTLQGNYGEAHPLYAEALRLSRDIGDQDAVARTLCRIGYLEVHQNDYARSTKLFAESLEIFQTRGDQQGIALSLAGYGELRRIQGRVAEAVRLLACVEEWMQSCPSSFPIDRVEYERSVVAVRTQLDEVTLAAAYSKGHAMTLDEAVQFALNGE